MAIQRLAHRRTRRGVLIGPKSLRFGSGLVLLIISSILAENQSPAPDIRKEKAEAASVFQDDENYTLTRGDTRAILGFRSDANRLRFELSKNGHAEAAANITIARKIEFLRPLLERFFAERGRAPRYLFVMNYYTELGARLADTAARSNEWNRSGGGAIGASGDFILKHLQKTDAPYIELSSTMESFHYRLAVDSIENRIVLPYKEFTPFEKSLMTTRVNPQDKLPIGASVYFVLTKEQ